MSLSVRISLANKCQLLFGAAVILIILSALTVVWFRMENLVNESHRDRAKQAGQLWLAQTKDTLGTDPPLVDRLLHGAYRSADITLQLVVKSRFDFQGLHDPVLSDAIREFQARPDRHVYFVKARDENNQPIYRYVQAIRQSHLEKADTSASAAATLLNDPLEMVLLIQLPADQAWRAKVLNQIYIITAGLVAMLLAIGVFWFITRRIILSPVRVLRDTAEKIAEGDINIRSDINTGDEFEQLSDMFNTMVSNLNAKEQELRQTNKSLDLKLGKLAEHNVALFEANQIKDDFLANVSHELRTPLHSIIGFAEVLQDTLKRRTGPVDEKRKRYIANIIASSRRLLDLINDLLDLAKIESGRVDLHIAPMSVVDTAEGLVNLIRPQAGKRGITLNVHIDKGIPLVETDEGKVQQILFNFLSNALKFTPAGGAVTLSAQPLGLGRPGQPRRIRLSVSDTGPGIAPEDHEKIFEKFTQLGATETREHGGTGLGLTICRDLTKLLQGEIELESAPDQGSTFNLTIPFEMQSTTKPLMPDSVV